MTLDAQPNEVTYQGDGITQTFPIPFPFDTAADLKVFLTDTVSGAVTPLITGWSVVGLGVLIAIAPAATIEVTLIDDPALTQPTDYVSNDAFPAESHERALDRVTRLCKRLHQQWLRTIRFPDADLVADGTITSTVNRRGKYLFFNAVTGAVEYAASVIGQTLSQSVIAQFLNPQTAAEITAGVASVNFIYPPGDVRRYGADPTGVLDSVPAFQTAIACNAVVFDGYPGGGSYVFNSSVVLPITNGPLTIRGQGKGFAAGVMQGTKITLATVAGAGAAHFHATGFVANLNISGITFTWQTFTTNQVAILLDQDCRASRFFDNVFLGLAALTTTVRGIVFLGGGTFTGDVDVYNNYITSVLYGVVLHGSCTTVRIVNNELYSNVAGPLGAIGVLIQYTGGTLAGIQIIGNTFEDWNQGIYVDGGSTVSVAYIRQAFNYFEANTIGAAPSDFKWVGGANNCVSIGDIHLISAGAVFDYTNSSGNVVMGGGYGDFHDSRTVNAFRGFTEQGRTVANGHQQTRAFAAGNYTGGGGWTVTSGEVVADMLIVNGNEATYYFEVLASTVTGGAASLVINLASFGVTATIRSTTTCRVVDNATAADGWCEIQLAGQSVSIQRNPAAANWSASTTATSVQGQIKFPINYTVN